MKIILPVIIFTFVSFASECLDQKDELGEKWLKSPTRTQMSGFLRFKGKGNNREESIYDAISHLKIECNRIDENIKIFEECKDSTGYYVRLSLKMRDCGSKKGKQNKELVRIYNSQLKKTRKCTDNDSCYKKAMFYLHTEQYKKSSSFFKKLCEESYGKSCFYLGVAYFKLKNFKKSLLYSSIDCKNNLDLPSCINAANAAFEIQKFKDVLKYTDYILKSDLINSSKAQALQLRLMTFMMMGRNSDAIEIFKDKCLIQSKKNLELNNVDVCKRIGLLLCESSKFCIKPSKKRIECIDQDSSFETICYKKK